MIFNVANCVIKIDNSAAVNPSSDHNIYKGDTIMTVGDKKNWIFSHHNRP